MNSYTCLNAGDKIGEFTFLKYVPKINNEISGLVVCPLCGNQFPTGLSRIGLGYKKSCGCLSKLGRITHGCATKKGRTPAYRSWADMRRRCYNKKYDQFKDYGGRGIIVCDRWLLKDGFKNFLEDMGERPIGKSLDRIDNDGGYEPTNCRWATKREQDRNRRSCRYIEFNGERKLISEWSAGLGGNNAMVLKRLKRGWPLDIALTTPAGHNTRKWHKLKVA